MTISPETSCFPPDPLYSERPRRTTRSKEGFRLGEREVITTDRLLLEPWHEGVREQWVALNADPRVYEPLGTGAPIARSHSEPEFEWMLAHWHEHGFGWRSVVDKGSGSWLGAVGLSFLGENPAGLPSDELEIGWWLTPESWGRGIATEAAAAVRDEGFAKRFAEHFWARHNARNPGSGRIMEKIGMSFVRDGSGVAGVPIRIYRIDRERWESLASS